MHKTFRGVEGVTTVHNNILVYGVMPAENHTNLRNCLRRAKKTGVRLKLEKFTILVNIVDWFRRVFSSTRVSASPDKINKIAQAGRPDKVEEVRSLLLQRQVFFQLRGRKELHRNHGAPKEDAGQGGEIQVDTIEGGQQPGTDQHHVSRDHPATLRPQEAKNVRHGAENVRHGAKNMRQCAKNV